MLMEDSDPISRLRRIRVIDDSYCETEWEYELPANLFGLGMGSVQLLENGNYLLYTFGSGLNQGQPTLREITSNHEVVWNYQGVSYAAWYRGYKIPSLHPDAFSIVVDGYTISDNGSSVVEISDSSLDFTIYNKSGYTQSYQYSFGDSTDGPAMFDYEEGEFFLDPYESTELSFLINNQDLTSTNIALSVWPTYHSYSQKDIFFDVTTNNNLLGDVNFDGFVNVLDIVMVVNIVLGNESELSAADLNSDSFINVLDIVFLVNIILGV